MSTTRQPSALVVRRDCLANDRLVDQIFNSLAADRRIALVAPEPVTLEQALILVDSREELGVIVLVGFEDQVTQIIDKIRKRRPAINFASFPTSAPTFSLNLSQPYGPGIVEIFNRPVSVGTIELVLGSPGSPEFIEIISLLLNGSDMLAGTSGRGVLVPFPYSQALSKEPRSAAKVDAPNPYITKALEAALLWTDAAVDALLKFWEKDPSIPGFPVKWAELRTWLCRLRDMEKASHIEVDDAFEKFLEELKGSEASDTPLARIAALLQDDLALQVLLIILSPELNPSFHRVFGAIHDDYGRRYPSVAIVCLILAAVTAKAHPLDIRVSLASLEKLRETGLIENFKSGVPPADTALRLEASAVDWILTGEVRRLLTAPTLAPLVVNKPAGVGRLLPEGRRDAVWAAYRSAVEENDPPPALLLTGSEPGWLQAEAIFLARTEAIFISPVAGAEAAVAQPLQVARLTGQCLIVDLSDWNAVAEAFWEALEPLLAFSSTPALILTQNPAPLLAATTQAEFVSIRLPAVTTEDREDAIKLLFERTRNERLAAELAERYRLPLDQLPDAAVLAHSAAADARREIPNAADWRTGFRAVAGAHLPALARRVEPNLCPNPDDGNSCLDRVVLPKTQKDQLRAVLDHVRFSHVVLDGWGFGELLHARGVSALFSGDSGTGKTLAAYSVASALATDLYVVDLARIVSKYIGETEKNLDIVFNEAERAGAVLLFDEADALFGKRSEVRDAHDRYANIEVAYLLQRMELFDGLAILTTNHPENVDPAFSRRLRFSIEFPRPDAIARLAIWEQSIPTEHREKGLDLEFLARRLELTGGSIRQIALHAAMAAARDNCRIGKDQVHSATRIELKRLGAHGDIGKLERVA